METVTDALRVVQQFFVDNTTMASIGGWLQLVLIGVMYFVITRIIVPRVLESDTIKKANKGVEDKLETVDTQIKELTAVNLHLVKQYSLLSEMLATLLEHSSLKEASKEMIREMVVTMMDSGEVNVDRLLEEFKGKVEPDVKKFIDDGRKFVNNTKTSALQSIRARFEEEQSEETKEG